MLEALLVSQILLWIALAALAASLWALGRQIGVLHERLAPLGALMTHNTAEIGQAAPQFDLIDLRGKAARIGGARDNGRSQLLLFVSPNCPMCKKLLPTARSFARAERQLELALVGDGLRDEHEALVREHGLAGLPFVISPAVGMTYGIGKLPYAVLIDAGGVVRSKGLVNSREHLDSLVTAFETGFTSIQAYVESRAGSVAAPAPQTIN
jgi:methylamine dehydrogenase accessory protein MauD